MLVLSRQKDQTIIIGDDIEITVVDIRGDKVRLGVSAPKRVSVHRKEVYDAIRREARDGIAVTAAPASAKLEQDYHELDADHFIACPGCGARVGVKKSVGGIEYIASHFVAKDVTKAVCARSATATEMAVNEAEFAKQSGETLAKIPTRAEKDSAPAHIIAGRS